VSAVAPDRRRQFPEHELPGLLPPHGAGAYEEFLGLYGPLPNLGEGLIGAVEQAGLAGRGGAGFPTARKLHAVRAGRRAVVVANGTEGEPASCKDEVLMRLNPHLVIDGALLAAEAIRARRVILAVGRDGDTAEQLDRALAGRADGSRVELVAAPERFVAGEESALVQYLNGGEAKPTSEPFRPFQRGVDGRPTLVQNVETLAAIALIARHGAAWSRSTGTADEPGSVLATIGGAVALPGVLEAPLGTDLSELFGRCGGLTQPAQAYLIGGYFGSWVLPAEQLKLSNASLATAGARLGARAIVALGADACGVRETARVVSYMAAESAEQCGPCVFGLRTLAARLNTIARAEPGAAAAYGQLEGLHRQIARRGACAHPDGVLGFAASATHVFAEEFAAHLAGHCCARSHDPVLPVPAGNRAAR
jgi:NADH:ubiquinone oxidoreductase subunit F (NADH-binding)